MRTRAIEGADEADLVRGVSDRDKQALAELLRRHQDAIQNLARRILGHVPAADDVTQDVFVQFWNRPQRFDPARGSLRSFLLMCCHGRCVDVARSESCRRARETRYGLMATLVERSCEEAVEARITAEQAHRAVASLPPNLRQPIALAFFEGYTYRQVAALLGQPEGTVKARIRSGLHRLRHALAEDAAP